MARRATTVTTGVLVLALLAGGGYLAADALDRVPGVLTTQPEPPLPAPFPTAPGAVPPAVDAASAVLGPLDPAAPQPDPAQVEALAAALVADPRMGASVGVLVVDDLTGEALADVGAGTARTPASTAKVLAAFAAVAALGPDVTLPTTVVQPEPGALVLVGGGDMMLAAGAGDPEATVGHAGLGDLAAATADALRLSGLTTVSLGVDDTLFTGPGIHPAWKPSDVAAGYVASVAPLAVDVAKMRDEEYPPRFPDPALHAAQTFAAALAAEGVTVTATARTTAPDGALELARVESAPLRDVARYAVQVSDNTVTEVLGRLVAVAGGLPGSFEGATRAVLAELEAQGLDTTGTVLDDCSGLSAESRVPARLLVEALRRATDPGQVALLPVVLDLPVGGWQGTLVDRFTEGPSEGLVRAKTGSLPGVTSLAGTVQTQDGRLLVFAVLADATPPGGQARPRAAIDAFVATLAGCGCQAS